MFVERKLLRLLLHDPRGVERVRGRTAPADFQDGVAREIAEALWRGEPPPMAGEAAVLARELAAEAIEVPDPEGELDLTVRFMVERRLRREKREREEALRRNPAGADALRLMHEIEDIARSLRNLSK